VIAARRAADDRFDAAVARLAAGGLVAYPTETVWGLGADARSEAGVERLRAWKGRPEREPISVLVEDAAALAALGIELPALGQRLVAGLWPGPLTLVLPCRLQLARGIARGDGAVGVRCSPHPVAAGLARCAREAGLGPVTATSLNRHGEPPARHWSEAARLCSGTGLDAPALVTESGPDAGGSRPSTVLDLTGPEPVVLRYGALGPDRIDPWLAGSGHA
jgi:L-threonylcarbamoyladenylate synthase